MAVKAAPKARPAAKARPAPKAKPKSPKPSLKSARSKGPKKLTKSSKKAPGISTKATSYGRSSSKARSQISGGASKPKAGSLKRGVKPEIKSHAKGQVALDDAARELGLKGVGAQKIGAGKAARNAPVAKVGKLGEVPVAKAGKLGEVDAKGELKDAPVAKVGKLGEVDAKGELKDAPAAKAGKLGEVPVDGKARPIDGDFGFPKAPKGGEDLGDGLQGPAKAKDPGEKPGALGEGKDIELFGLSPKEKEQYGTWSDAQERKDFEKWRMDRERAKFFGPNHEKLGARLHVDEKDLVSYDAIQRKDSPERAEFELWREEQDRKEFEQERNGRGIPSVADFDLNPFDGPKKPLSFEEQLERDKAREAEFQEWRKHRKMERFRDWMKQEERYKKFGRPV